MAFWNSDDDTPVSCGNVADVISDINGMIAKLQAIADCKNTRIEEINECIERMKIERQSCNKQMERADRIIKALEKIIE